jgi:ribonuclease III
MAKDPDRLQQLLQHRFSDQALVRLALTHRSADKINNERLEFLGDALLDLVVGELLYNTYPDADEGELSRLRSRLVNKTALASIGRSLQLGEFIRLGTGEAKSGGRQRNSILADTVEALVAAVYLDAGLAVCANVVNHVMAELLAKLNPASQAKDYKTRLQELMQAKGLNLPQYLVVDTQGEAHEQIFFVECAVSLLVQPLRGSGNSKRLAEQEAAHKVLAALGEQS